MLQIDEYLLGQIQSQRIGRQSLTDLQRPPPNSPNRSFGNRLAHLIADRKWLGARRLLKREVGCDRVGEEKPIGRGNKSMSMR
jgi:hypothetical protein